MKLLKKLTLLVFVFLASSSWADENIVGDVMVIFKALPGTTVTRESLTEGGRDYERVKSIAEELDAQIVEVYVAISKARNVVFVMLHSDSKSEKTLMEELLSLPDVISASLNYKSELMSDSASSMPNDPMYPRQWGLKAIRASQAWNITSGDPNVYVAVIDSGVDYNHVDLIKFFDHAHSKNFYGGLTHLPINVDQDSYFDENGHGTHVAGIIGAQGHNKIGVTGVSWRTNIISLRVFGYEDNNDLSNIGTKSIGTIVVPIKYL